MDSPSRSEVHNNYYFLRQISARLNEKLVGLPTGQAGFTLVSCFSQNRDEIVFEFNDAKDSFFIKGDLQGDLSCLTFPETFRRAKKNSIDLFDEVIMKKVTGVRQFLNERSFVINLEEGLGVLFKMHGNKANVLLVRNDEVIRVFRNNLSGEMETDRSIDWSREAFEKEINPEKLYFTFGKPVWTYLGERKHEWEAIQKVKASLEDPSYYIVRTDKKILLSLLPLETIVEKFTDPFRAVNSFYSLCVSENAFIRERNVILTRLRTDIGQTTSWLAKTNAKLDELRGDEHYKAWGDLIMANLHNIEAGKDSVQLEDFYNPGHSITIKIDTRLSPQKNAERYYRKGKNQQIEIGKLTEGVRNKSATLSKLESDLARGEDAKDLRSLRGAFPDFQTKQSSQAASLPFREFEYKGFKIWVGKDAKSNDELTLKYSYKEDLWFHVRDDSGSHVLLKHRAGKPFPKDVIDHAASIAGFFSKRKTEALCAVIVTPKKFVRKRKGDPAGAVVVEREDVILVEPKSPQT